MASGENGASEFQADLRENTQVRDFFRGRDDAFLKACHGRHDLEGGTGGRSRLRRVIVQRRRQIIQKGTIVSGIHGSGKAIVVIPRVCDNRERTSGADIDDGTGGGARIQRKLRRGNIQIQNFLDNFQLLNQ